MFNLTPATRKITTALGAAAIALGAMAATALPARANNDELARVLAGTAALVIIGSALKNQSHTHAYHPGPPVSRVRPAPPPVQPTHGWNHGRPHGGWHQPKPLPAPRPGWTPPPPQGVCTVWINGQRYTRHGRDCAVTAPPRPQPHNPGQGWGRPYPYPDYRR